MSTDQFGSFRQNGQREDNKQVGEESIDALKDAFAFVASAGQRVDDMSTRPTMFNYNKLQAGKSEIRELLRMGGEEPTDEELDHLLSMRDLDSNGTLEFGEFMKSMLEIEAQSEEDLEAEELFNLFSKGKDEIPAKDFMEMMWLMHEDISEEECKAMMLDLDTIDRDFFRKIISLDKKER